LNWNQKYSIINSTAKVEAKIILNVILFIFLSLKIKKMTLIIPKKPLLDLKGYKSKSNLYRLMLLKRV